MGARVFEAVLTATLITIGAFIIGNVFEKKEDDEPETEPETEPEPEPTT